MSGKKRGLGEGVGEKGGLGKGELRRMGEWGEGSVG